MKERTELLIGRDGVENLAKRHVTIVGVGGVGGYVATMLARAGIGRLTIIDFDIVSESNINRQVVANIDTVGQKKVLVLEKMLKKINPKLEIIAFDEKLTEGNVAKLVTPCDICVDAIDSVKDKVALIKYCKTNNIEIISAMGAGNRVDIPKFFLTDIFKTHDDGLAKAVRKRLREEGIKNLDVVTCESKATPCGDTIGSISYYPAMCGITLSAVIINKFLDKKG